MVHFGDAASISPFLGSQLHRNFHGSRYTEIDSQYKSDLPSGGMTLELSPQFNRAARWLFAVHITSAPVSFADFCNFSLILFSEPKPHEHFREMGATMRHIELQAKFALIALAMLITPLVTRLVLPGISAANPVKSPRSSTSIPRQQQFPIMDRIADKVIQKYETSSCEELWQEKAQNKNKPRSQEERNVIALLKGDPDMRQAFIGKVAGPIANKMFECGIIP
jgi:hypothetical protein